MDFFVAATFQRGMFNFELASAIKGFSCNENDNGCGEPFEPGKMPPSSIVDCSSSAKLPHVCLTYKVPGE